MEKKAQLQLTFNWIYILIAGVVILLFFVGIILKGQTVAEQSLEQDIVRIVESILIGAGVSENTKNFIDVSGLTDYILEFKCEDDFASLGIKGGAFKEIPIEPVFAPLELRTSGLILWSVPYELPFKVIDLLMATSVNTKYFVVGDGEFKEELEKAVKFEQGDRVRFNFDFEGNFDLGGNYQARVVYLEPIGSDVPGGLQGEEKVTAVDISGREITYYTAVNGRWAADGGAIPLISLPGEKEAAKYAAIFAGNAESYKCNMRKAFKRLEYVTKVYEGKLNELLEYYENPLADNQQNCKFILKEKKPDNMADVFNFQFKSWIVGCKTEARREDFSYCVGLLEPAEKLRNLNEELRSCIQLY